MVAAEAPSVLRPCTRRSTGGRRPRAQIHGAGEGPRAEIPGHGRWSRGDGLRRRRRGGDGNGYRGPPGGRPSARAPAPRRRVAGHGRVRMLGLCLAMWPSVRGVPLCGGGHHALFADAAQPQSGGHGAAQYHHQQQQHVDPDSNSYPAQPQSGGAWTCTTAAPASCPASWSTGRCSTEARGGRRRGRRPAEAARQMGSTGPVMGSAGLS